MKDPLSKIRNNVYTNFNLQFSQGNDLKYWTCRIFVPKMISLERLTILVAWIFQDRRVILELGQKEKNKKEKFLV